MYYYDVWVRSNRYKSASPLTYSHPQPLRTGQIVSITLQNNAVLGFISSRVLRPKFKTKSINYVYNLPVLHKKNILLLKWIQQYYPSDIGVATSLILPVNLPQKNITEEVAKTINDTDSSLPELTFQQKNALLEINIPDTYLLHGRTGSGKTRVYIELIKNTLLENKSAIILTPEISLTSQLYKLLEDQFGDLVLLIHSKQTPKERRLVWLKCLIANQPLVIIGPRSALFAPLEKIGLIVVDESHEGAYKQDQMPHYNSIRVASYIAKLHKAILILGSATPLVNDYYIASSKGKKIITMNQLAKSNDFQETEITEIVDIRDRNNFSNSYLISNQLIASIKKSIKNGEQSLLYLNRRGTAKMIFCENCGWEMLCHHCQLPLTFHGDKNRLVCHSCGRMSKQIPINCPSCNSSSIIYKTPGTKAIVDEIKKIFPAAKIERFDTDNSKSESFENNYTRILKGQVDILIGTQLLAKGIDLPKLSTLGVMQADTSLYLPDYTSEERTFQLISQILGRINRGHIEGRAIIQTYNPESHLLKMAISQNYTEFYKQELNNRRNFKLPPFYHLLKLSVIRKSPSSSEKSATRLKELLVENIPEIIVEGPLPAFHEKHGVFYEWHLVVKSTNRSRLLSVIEQLPSGWRHDIDPSVLL